MRPIVVGALLVCSPACSRSSNDIPTEPVLVQVPAPLDAPPVVQTTAPDSARAGEMVVVNCAIEPGTDGDTFIGLEPEIRVVPEGSVSLGSGGTIEATRAGQIEIACAYPEADLIDETPAVTMVVAGSPVSISTDIDSNVVVAGDVLDATCTTLDAFGNVVLDAAPGLRLLPEDPANSVVGRSVTVTRAGRYSAACTLPGAIANSREVEVVPALPAALQVAPVPDQALYRPGQTVVVEPRVTDRFGNAVFDAAPTVVSAPAAQPFGSLGYRFVDEGSYVLTVEVAPPTESGNPLVETLAVDVNAEGPTIVCDLDGRMVTAAPGDTVSITGSVSDAFAVASLTVDGQPVTVDPTGAFVASVPVRFGHNFVDLVASDGLGEQSAGTCTFLAAPQWGAENAALGGTVTTSLFQAAIDDADRTDLDSFGDLLDGVLDSPDLLVPLDDALRAANPLKDSCDQEIFGLCVFRSRLDYRGITLDGPNTTSLTLTNGGLDARVVIRNMALEVDLSGTVSSTVTATIDAVVLDLGFDILLDGSGPSAVVRSTQVDVQGLDVDLSGVPSLIDSIVLGLFNGFVQDLIDDVFETQIRDAFGPLLDELLSALDVTGFGTTVEIPRLDGSGTVPLTFGLDFSNLDVTPSRLRLGIGTLTSAPAAIATPSLGVPLPPGPILADPSPPQSAAVAIQVGLLNQVLHTLWRGGLLEGELSGADLGLDPTLTASLRATLPPVADVNSRGTTLGIGPLAVGLAWPGVLDEELTVGVGALASAEVSLDNGVLAFGGLALEEVHLTTGGLDLDPATRNALETLAERVVQDVLTLALADALPALPIPSFPIPDLGLPGVPAGTTLGVTDLALDNSPPHYVLAGSLQVLP